MQEWGDRMRLDTVLLTHKDNRPPKGLQVSVNVGR